MYVGMLANKFGIKVIHLESFELKTPKPELQCIPITNVTTLERHDLESICLIYRKCSIELHHF